MSRPFPPFVAFLLVVPAAAGATELPQRKSGLWEISTSSDATAGQSMTMQMCIDQATDDAARAMGEGFGRQQCSKVAFRREGPQRFVSESVCRIEQTTATTRGVFSGDFASAYRAEISNRYDPPLLGRREDRLTMQARWLGPCKPGMKPGDMMLPGGMVVPGALAPRVAAKK